ncbi:MAG TPA: hypothetical protein ENO18_03255 [Caldithrix sp.]|nr:hypothetical protein [Caldithrix sp.]
METAFPLVSKDDVTELYGYCNVIMDHLRPLLNSNQKELSKDQTEVLQLTLKNLKPLIDEMLPPEKFDAVSQALQNYKPNSEKKDNDIYADTLTRVINSLLPKTYDIPAGAYDPILSIDEVIETAFVIAEQVQSRFNEIRESKQ